MSKTKQPDAFAAIRRARTLRERHPDAPSAAVHVAQTLASFADGRTGANIRPTHETVAKITGYSERHVRRAISWLVNADELRLDEPGFRGQAAKYTLLGVGKADTGVLHSVEKGGHLEHERRTSETGKQDVGVRPPAITYQDHYEQEENGAVRSGNGYTEPTTAQRFGASEKELEAWAVGSQESATSRSPDSPPLADQDSERARLQAEWLQAHRRKYGCDPLCDYERWSAAEFAEELQEGMPAAW